MSIPRLVPRCANIATVCLRQPAKCSQCLRRFSSFFPRAQESRRRLQTVSAYHPTTLDMPPPPRNAGVVDTSITSQTPPPPRLREESKEEATVSLREGEAQKPKPISNTVSSSSEGKTERPKRKLRPRKAAMVLTPPAVEHLQALLSEGKMIRVGVKNRGCSGLAYHLEYVDKPGMFDEAVEQDGVKVLIDSKALFSIIGSEMDWLEDKLSARFVFKNPNITEQCGCGESFSVG